MLRCCVAHDTSILQAGGQPDSQEESGKTALHLAVMSGAKDVVAGLLAANTSCAVLDEGGCTALHFAAQLCDLDIFNLIYAQPSSSVTQPDSHGAMLPRFRNSLSFSAHAIHMSTHHVVRSS